MLNKITEETFQSMSTQILLMIETADATLFKGVVKLIFEKALWEPKFGDMYAELCRQINDKCPEVPQKGQQVLLLLVSLQRFVVFLSLAAVYVVVPRYLIPSSASELPCVFAGALPSAIQQ
jgi:hypothetical protein